MTPVQTPNLPKGAVALVVLAAGHPAIAESLRQEGIGLLEVVPTAALPTAVASHSDLQLLHLGDKHLLLAKEAAYLQHALQADGFITNLLAHELGNSYPHDISLNFLLLEKSCFGLYSNMPLQLIKHCKDAGLQIIDTRQGYARCSVAVVAENAAITADTGLYRLLCNRGVDVLQIPAGDILLPGYDTGFIGGCCGCIGNDRIAFTGVLENHSWGKQVLAFLEKHQVTPVYLQDGKLLDIGGILPLAER